MKNTPVRIIALLALSITGLQAVPAQNGWRIVDQGGEITLISKGRLKQAWGEDALIMDGAKNRILFLSAEKKAYASGTPDEYCALMKEVQDELIAKLPPDQREAVTARRGQKEGDTPPAVVVKYLGAGEKVSGLATDKYAVMVDSKLYEEVWLATDADFLKHFKPLVSIFRSFSQCVSSMAMKDDVESTKEYLDLYEKGVEVKARRAGSGDEEDSGQEAQVERVTLTDSEFAIPAGYSTMALREFVRSQMGGMEQEP